jgi:transglutaminase-like putative cysteine protease
MRTFRKRDTRIPRRPLLWLAAALLFTLPPMFGTLALWVPVLFFIILAAKFWMEPRGYRLRSVLTKMLLATISLAAVVFTYGTVQGVEPGVSLIVVLVALKILEAHTAREFQVLVMVGWVLCLCGFFLSQDLAMALCLLIAFTLLLVALIQFHRGASSPAFWPPLRTACTLVAQALPLIVLLFLLFPRITTGLRFQFAQLRSAAAGFSDRLSPGSVASLASSTDVAFRAEFPDGKMPPPGAMYWRGVVMSRGDGLEWRAPDPPAAIHYFAQSPTERGAIRQWITIEPHGARWMFALDWPSAPPSGATLAPGNYLWSGQPIRKPRRYEVISFREIREKELRPRERRILLEVPTWITPAVRDLAHSWTAAHADDQRAVIAAALQYFRTAGFRYSLSPGVYKEHDLEEFLLQRRTGFCEHYAASFATLMRLAGIPARVVAGYLGGEYNEFGRFFLVRQSDSHAWCEVWLEDSRWIRVDPTGVVAPERLNLGSLLELRDSSARSNSNTFARNIEQRPIFNQVRQAWDALNYAWGARVLSFDAEAQRLFVADIGITNRTPVSLIVWTLLLATGILAIYSTWMRLRTRPSSDRVKTLYERFCRKAAAAGVRREPWEGPSHFSDRAACVLPNESERIHEISQIYISFRYAAKPASALLNKLADEVNAFSPVAIDNPQPTKSS